MKKKDEQFVAEASEAPERAVATKQSESFRATQSASFRATQSESSPEAQDAPANRAAGEVFDVRPSETVSIVAGNRVLYLGEGLCGITIKKKED